MGTIVYYTLLCLAVCAVEYWTLLRTRESNAACIASNNALIATLRESNENAELRQAEAMEHNERHLAEWQEIVRQSKSEPKEPWQ